MTSSTLLVDPPSNETKDVFYIKRTLKTFKINIGLLIMSSHKDRREKVSFPSFLSWPPSIAHTLSQQITRYIVLDGFCPWFRGGCTACRRGRDGFQCGEDVFPSNHAQRTIEILQIPFFLDSLVFWLIYIKDVYTKI